MTNNKSAQLWLHSWEHSPVHNQDTAAAKVRRKEVGAFLVDDINIAGAIDELNTRGRNCERPFLVVTPNLTNIAIYQQDQRVRQAYGCADLILADGWPVAVAARWHGHHLALVPGSLLLPAWVAQLETPTNFLVIGGKNGLAITQALHRLSPFVERADYEDSTWSTLSPDLQRLNEHIVLTKPDVLLLLLGSPKQEVLAMAAIEAGFSGLILCLGAAGDFLAQTPKRAPRVIQNAGLEWLHRIAQEPTRLGPRYLKSLKPFFFAIRK